MEHNTVWQWLVHGARSGWLLWVVLCVVLIVVVGWIVKRGRGNSDR